MDETSPPKSKTVKVSANTEWFDTGIDLLEGQKFMTLASGEWSHGTARVYGPLGSANTKAGTLVPGIELGALVAKIGEEGFYLGDRMQMPSPESGRLYLSINDYPKAFRDNRGSLEVTIIFGTSPQ